MPDLQVGNPFGLKNVSGDNSDGAINNVHFVTIARMKTALQTDDAALYTDEMLNRMTYNDLVYAIQVNGLSA